MKSIVSIILAMLMALNLFADSPKSEEELLESISPDCQSAALFIEENFDLFKEKFNEESPELNWKAQGIEDKKIIEVLLFEGTEAAVFLDFSGNDGYAVLADDFIMYDFQTEGESPLKNVEGDGFAYSVVSGYLYLKDGEYYSVDEDNNSTEEFWENNIQTAKTYKGQESGATGCGKITDTDKYVEAKYGKGWDVQKSRSLPMTGYGQFDLSVYCENQKNGSTCSEGNCWVVSAYNVLQYYADNKYSSKMPKSTEKVTYNPKKSEAKIYGKYYNSKGVNISGIVKVGNVSKNKYVLRANTFEFTSLWAKTRTYVNDKYGKIQSGTVWQTENIIKNVAANYGVTIKTNLSTAWAANYMNVISKVNNGNPFIWSTSNDTYGSHTMAGCGYKLYSKTTKVWKYDVVNYKMFYELKDGHTAESRYYDVSGHIGFSAIIFLEGK